ncbi:MAG: response regulator [Clostridiales bacterium]|nr:response regulator [Clostridiales bacterium]
MNSQKTMLIVDDVEASREAVSAAFSGEYRILTAADGVDAMEQVKKHAGNITVILLDIVMPRMDGMSFLKWLTHSAYEYIPVLAVTADESCQVEALKNDAWDFISKPVENEVIRARLNNVLGRYVLEDECRRSEEATRAKREMDNLVNSIPGGIARYRITDHFETVYFSDGVAALSGHTRVEYAAYIRGDATKIIYEKDRERVMKSVRDALRSGRPVDETYRICHKNGGLAWVHINGAIIGQEDGVPILHAVFQRPSQMVRLYDDLVNDSQNIVYVSDTELHDLLYINNTGLRAIGKEGVDYSHKKCYEFLLDRTSPCEFCKINCLRKDGYMRRDFVYPVNGKTYSMRGKLADWNGIPAHVEYVEDVTEIRQSEQRNEDLNRQIRSMMENTPDGLCMYRVAEGKLHPLLHNQAFYDMLGYSPEHRKKVDGSMEFMNVHPDDLPELRRRIEQAIAGNEGVNWTFRLYSDARRRYIWLNLNAVVLPQSDGTKLCYASFIDVTNERETQEKLIQTKQGLENMQLQAQSTLSDYQALVNAVPGGIAQYEIRDGKVLTRYFSDGICELTGYSREEREQMNRRDVMSTTAAEDTPVVALAIQKAVANRENLNLTYRIRTKSGSLRWVHLSAAYSAGARGECLYQAVFTDVDKLKRIEQQLQENQLRYEVAIKSSGINIWEYDIQEDCLYVVSSSARIKQDCFRIEHYVNSTLENDYVRRDCIDRFLSIFTRLREGAREVTEDIWYKTTDEAGWWCERVTYTTTFDESGKPAKAFGAGRDVTREKEAEKKFREESSYRKAMQSDNLASVMIDLTDNRVVEIDAKFQTVLALSGHTADDFFEQTATLMTDAKTVADFRKKFSRKVLLNQFGSGEFTASMELTRLYDTAKVYWINFDVHMLRNPNTGHVVARVADIDITWEKVMQTIMSTVTETDYDFFVVVDGSTDSGVEFGTSAEEHFLTEHDSFEENIGALIKREVCREDVQRVMDECRIDRIWSWLEKEKAHKFSFGIRTSAGEIRRKQVQFTAISSVRKTFLLSRIDVTDVYEEQEAAKANLQRALADAEEADRVKTDFLSRMSHDIRTPMNAVLSLAALGRDSQNLGEARDYLHKIGTSGQYLLAIINDVLNLSKMENRGLTLHPETVFLSSFIQDTVGIVMPTAREKKINLKVETNGISSKYMKLDTTYVRQVAVNLLSNAIKFTPPGGSVVLTLTNLSRSGRFVENRMTVRDTGIGISPAFLPKIFTPFEQEDSQNDAARQGTGLGLSIVHEIVEQMGGRIWVESEKGRGTTFYVEWRLETVPEEEALSEVSAPVAGLRQALDGRRVLLVEDHPLNAEIARQILHKKGITVKHAANGQEAVELFSASATGFYDAILMDIRMPVMNGLEATNAIRRLDRPDAPTVPIIAMTANAFDEDKQKSLAAGMNAHLAKPIDPQKLYDTLAGCMAQKAADRATEKECGKGKEPAL